MQLLVYLYNFINDNVQLYEVVFSFFIGALKDKHNLHSKANNCTQTLCIIYVRFTFCITLYLVNRSIIFLSEASNKCSHIVLHIVSVGCVEVAQLGRPWRSFSALFQPRRGWLSSSALCYCVIFAIFGRPTVT